MRCARPLLAGCLLLSLGAPAPSSAQPLRDFAALKLKPDQRVRVDLDAGRRMTGAVFALTDSTLALTVNGTLQEIRARDIRALAVRRGYARRGALIGAGTSSAAMLLFGCLSSAKDAACDFDIPIVFGGGAGALVGSLIHPWKPLYPQPAHAR